jgi:hypothetical protein
MLEAKEATVRSMLAIAHTAHGTEFKPVAECDCPICTCKIGQCVECFGTLLNEEDPDECV